MTNLFKSSLGRKFIMAASGIVLFLFVVGHLLGNLQVFLGPEAINRYGDFLQSNVELLWPVRVFLILMVVLHIWSATRLTIENRAARPLSYEQYRPVGSSYASRTMMMSGIIIFCFVIYHLLHFTAEVRYVNLTGRDFASFVDEHHRHDIFKMLVVGFSNGWVSGFYIFAMALLCLHLSHGLSSMFQSLGWKNKAYTPILDRAAGLVSGLIFLGYASIPLAILMGYGKGVLK